MLLLQPVSFGVYILCICICMGSASSVPTMNHTLTPANFIWSGNLWNSFESSNAKARRSVGGGQKEQVTCQQKEQKRHHLSICKYGRHFKGRLNYLYQWYRNSRDHTFAILKSRSRPILRPYSWQSAISALLGGEHETDYPRTEELWISELRLSEFSWHFAQ